MLLLVVFGPGKAVSMARDLGRFANEARGHVEEFKSELTAPVQEFKDGIRHSAKEPQPETVVPEAGDGPTVDSSLNDDGQHRPKGGKELPDKEEASPSEVHARLE